MLIDSHTRHCYKDLHQIDEINIIPILILETRKLEAQRGYLRTGGIQTRALWLSWL